MEGWISLHRKLLDNPIVCKDSDHMSVWMYLLLNATHKEYASVFMGKKIMLQPGQLITGRKAIAEKFNIDESKVQRILKRFENEQQIEQQNGNKNRLITVLSWSLYQNNEQQNEQQMNNKCTTTEQQVNTYNNVNNINNDNKKDIKPLVDKPPTYDDEFENFWLEYPSVRRRDKAKSYDKWKVAIKTISKTELTECVKRYAKDKKAIGHDGGYAKMPVTFLNGKTYMDYVRGDKGDETSEHTERIGGKYSEYVIE